MKPSSNKMLVLLVLVAMTATFTMCKKTTIVVPKACFTSGQTEINKGDSIVFKSCSVADDVMMVFPKAGDEDLYAGPAFRFDSSQTITHVFEQSGTYTATLRAVNDKSGSPIQEVTQSIIVH